jgi:hypothetical protein
MGRNAPTASTIILSAMASCIFLSFHLPALFSSQAKAASQGEQERMWRQISLCTKDVSRIASSRTHSWESGASLPVMSYPVTPNSCRLALELSFGNGYR